MAKMTVETTTVATTVEVPAGRYSLGDPRYVIEGKRWRDLLKSCGCFGASMGGGPIGTIDGHEVLAFGTMYGDGTYPGSDRKEYGVDSGLIGLVPEGLVPGFTNLIEFTEPTICYADKHGMLHFGDIAIDTAAEPEDVDPYDD